MTKIAKSKYRQDRRFGVNLWGSAKSTVTSRNYPPGEHGKTAVPNTKDYKKQLEAKQKLKWYYGGSRFREKQFYSIFKEATRLKGDTGENFIGLLERRLDAAVYRLGIAPTIFAARQIISHKHVKVNGKVVNVASYRLKLNDTVELVEDSKNIPILSESIENNSVNVPEYWEYDTKRVCGKLLRYPVLSDVPYPVEMNMHYIIEYYSR